MSARSDSELLALDDAARAKALGPGSFIVEAPAGAGKTELLTQRFLALLPTVQDPEEIVALTFTNKAAAEMRARILDSLRLAATGVRPGDDMRHRQITYDLGRRALEADAERNWGLLRHAGRLQVTTLDALCGRLARQMPFLSRFGAQPAICVDSAPHYRQAARGTLDMLEEEGPLADVVARVLDFFDNDANRLQKLLEAMLATRDQWLGHAVGDAFEAGAAVDAVACTLVNEELAVVATAFPAAMQRPLMSAARYAASQAAAAPASQQHIACLEDWTGPLVAQVDDLPRWRALIDLLLTAEGTVRQQLPRNLGLSEKTAKAHAEAFKECFATLRHANVETALARVRALPDPRFGAEESQLVADLVALVRIAASQLWLVFQEQRETDFIQVARNALQALGEDDAPSDLRERLDYRIAHLLVDEFQDTSPTQVDLLEKLTAGWLPDDGRSLFLVGDPMQSIYRFRKADVGLFLKVRDRGIGQIRLMPLRLHRNNRSWSAVVDWVNCVFPLVFARGDDLRRGAVKFAPSAAARGALAGACVAMHPLIADSEIDDDSDDAPLTPADQREAQQVIDLVRAARARNPQGSVAILVRARSHLLHLTAELRRQGADLRYQAVEIETLAERQEVQDLVALTRALHHRADRVNWLAILRAPWCGLTLADLHVLAADDHRRTIWQLMQEDERIARMSADGRQRLLHLRGVVADAFVHQGRQRPRRWVEGVWQSLGGPFCLQRESDLLDVMEYFQLLDGLDGRGGLDLDRLDSELAALYAAPDPAGDAVQIMTIHKSKGLEFDTVILPGLHRKPRPQDKALLIWDQVVLDDGAEHLMVAAIPKGKPQRSGPPTRYDYLREFEKARADNEDQRVLYVAATRAIRELHLLGIAKPNPKGDTLLKAPARGSALALLWELVESEFEDVARAQQSGELGVTRSTPLPDSATFVPRLIRLAAAAIPAALCSAESAVGDTDSGNGSTTDESGHGEATSPLDADIGILVHRYLDLIAREGLDAWPAARIEKLGARLGDWFLLRGHGAADATRAGAEARSMLLTALSSETGRWILGPHEAAACELAVTTAGGGALHAHVVDRTFVDDGVRWIIDYKTERREDATLAAAGVHRAQLERYSRLFSFEDRTVKAALYFVAHDRMVLVPGDS